MTELATLTIDGPVARITLNRAEQRNAMSVGLLEALHARMDDLEQAEGVVATVLTGAGRAFCAGMDLKEIVVDESAGGSGDATLPLRLLESLAKLTLRVRTLPSVTVAAVNGAAIGGGCGLACVCDLAISHADAKLGFPEVDLGLCPAVVAPWLVRKIGAGSARAVLLRGGVINGADAHRFGFVDHVAPNRDQLDSVTDKVVSRLATGGPTALAVTKGLLNELDGSLDENVVLRGAALSAEVVLSPSAQAILSARLTN
ncbi:MAG: enoyl-CoA hydratase/isomerase family protein [Planctomycetota bacterium]